VTSLIDFIYHLHSAADTFRIKSAGKRHGGWSLNARSRQAPTQFVPQAQDWAWYHDLDSSENLRRTARLPLLPLLKVIDMLTAADDFDLYSLQILELVAYLLYETLLAITCERKMEEVVALLSLSHGLARTIRGRV
jgi:hypothetical protein